MKHTTFAAIFIICLTMNLPVCSQEVTVATLLSEMTDFDLLASRPNPWYKQGQATSYDRESHKGGDAWFANYDVGQYVRTDTVEGRTEHVLADLTGPGTVSRFWSANPDLSNMVRFYFDGEATARLQLPLKELFTGKVAFLGPEFSYLSGTGGNLYFPFPYSKSLKITIEETQGKLRLYYEIGYRAYEKSAQVRTFHPNDAESWRFARIRTGQALSRPEGLNPTVGVRWQVLSLKIPAGQMSVLPALEGEKAVFSFSARVIQTEESADWNDPKRAHMALRHLLLDISFDGEPAILTPLGDFFGSGPGINPYENLYFSVSQDGWMNCRLLMPFKKTMVIGINNTGSVTYSVDLLIGSARHDFTSNSYHLRAQWGSLVRESWPPFDISFLDTQGEGKVIGTVYQVTNPSYIWWGEGDQKISIDGEAFPSSFGTGTEDDYGFAYGYNGPFTRPYHAQTRVDGPASGGHISLNRWYVLDALPYRSKMRFDQELWHWMPCTGYWSHVIYWYAKPGTPGPRPIDTSQLLPMDLGNRADMLELIEGEDLIFEAGGGTASNQRLANCSGARHLVWKNGAPGDTLKIHFPVPETGSYEMMINLCQSPDYGKYGFKINHASSDVTADGWSGQLYWIRPVLGVFNLQKGDNILKVTLQESNPQAQAGNGFGLDYIFLKRIN